MSRTEPVTPALYSAKLMDRLVGIWQFETWAFAAVRHDPRATRQALILVILMGLGAAVGPGTRRPSVWQMASPLLGFGCWIMSAWLMVWIGTRLLGTPTPENGWRPLLRLLGFVPTVAIAAVVAPAPPVPDVYVFALTLLWGLALVVKAVRHTFGPRTAPAIATVLLAEMLVFALFLPGYFAFRSWGWA